MLRLSFYPIGDSYLLVVTAAIVLLVLLSVGPVRGGLGRRRVVLVGIRLAVIALVILAMLRPTLVYTEIRKQPATLVVLIDKSRSMSVPDAIGGMTRWEALRRALDDGQDALAAIAEDFEVKVYAFGAEADPVDLVDGEIRLEEIPGGKQTAIGAVLEDVLRREAGKRLLGVILLSDGAQRAYAPRDLPPQTAVAQMKPLGSPLFTFPFGQARGLGQAQDVAVADLLADQQVYVKNELEISGRIRVHGYVNRDIPLRLLFETAPGKMEVVVQENLRPTADGQVIPFKLSYAPQVPGEYRLTVEATEQPGELATTNNRLSTFVNVLAGGLKVSYLEGAL